MIDLAEYINHKDFQIMNWSPKVQDIVNDIQIETVTDIYGDLYPCGCGVKLDLLDVVYPALKKLDHPKHLLYSKNRNDASIYLGKFRELNRLSFNHHNLKQERNCFQKLIEEKNPHSIIELFSTKDIYTKNPTQCVNNFDQYTKSKFKLFDDLVEKSLNKGCVLEYGKGHSISGRQNLTVFDFISYAKDDQSYTVVNNDTIITADGLLNHKSLISVFTALNNSLNDLFIYGATKNISIYPVYDGNLQEQQQIEKHINTYKKLYSQMGVEINILQTPPLNMNSKIIGSTSIGHTTKQIPFISQLKEGHEIWLTRDLGDLSLLNYFKKLLIKGEKIPEDLKQLRIKVFRDFMTPNFELAKTISDYLPDIHKDFNEDQHIFVSTDASGPGLQVLEDACNLSGKSIKIENLNYLYKDSLNNNRRNHTSSTNGPIILVGHPKVMKELVIKLKDNGAPNIWKLGEVLPQQSKNILISRELLNTYLPFNPFSKFSNNNELIFVSWDVFLRSH